MISLSTSTQAKYDITYRLKSPRCASSWQSFSATQSRSHSCQVSFTVTVVLDLLTHDKQWQQLQ